MPRNSTGVSIVGWGETEFGELPDKDFYDLLQNAAYGALENAGLSPGKIDGLLTVPPMSTKMPSGMVSSGIGEYLGLMPGLKYASSASIGAASHVQHLAQGVHAINGDMCDYVLVVAADSLATGFGSEAAIERMAEMGHPEFENPYGTLIPSMYALAARRHMHEYGTTERQLAKIASIEYEHSSLQPGERVHMGGRKSVDEILNSPMVASPLTLDQCSLISDGGAAVVLTDSQRAHSEHSSPVDILSVGEYSTHESILGMPNLTTTGAVEAGQQALKRARVEKEQIDVLEIYDCFTITALEVLEDLGFCKKGHGGEFIESGEVELGGKWPMNTHGGLLAQAHPGYPGGMMHITEAVRQLKGKAGKTQVNEAEIALVHNNSYILSTHAVALLGKGG